jgi:hypothetical protein
VPEDQPVVRAPTPPAGSPQPSPGTAGTPERQGWPHYRASLAGNGGETGAGLGTNAADAAASDIPRARVHVPWRLVIVLVLALIGFATGIWAVALFPNRPPVINPRTFVIGISAKDTLERVVLLVYQGTQSTKITVEPEVAITNLPDEAQNEGFVEISVFGTKNSISCPSGVNCQFGSTGPGSGQGSVDAFVPIIAGGAGPNLTGEEHTITIKYPQLGFAANGESAIADLPDVHMFSPSSSATVLSVTFFEHNANMYDWSLPPVAALPEGVRWDEPLSSSLYAAQPTEITGTNLQAQAQDARDTFIAGILLGVAGGAAIAAIEEGLHMVFDNRGNRRRAEPSRQATSS